ncbi:arginine repressor [Dongshaea marina]|uniref:arginine repressor n=1 Tax=Dongshaea marina TaxID=2047966 RepID=UPI000D3E06E2|nr:ArgR family transcriptional regulator [Dongshaea marina]
MSENRSGQGRHCQETQQLDACRLIVEKQCCSTQEEIRSELAQAGFAEISQSTVSRLLHRLGVVKAQNASGKKVYTLVEQQLEPVDNARSVPEMVRDISHNEHVILIKTAPGAANVVARLLDRQPMPEVMGSVAGNDVVLIAPRHITRIKQSYHSIRKALELNLNSH